MVDTQVRLGYNYIIKARQESPMTHFHKLASGLYVNRECDIRISDTPRTIPRVNGENWGVHWKTSTVGCAYRIKHSEFFKTLADAKTFANVLVK